MAHNHISNGSYFQYHVDHKFIITGGSLFRYHVDHLFVDNRNKYKYRVNPLKVNKAQKVIHSYSKAVEKRSGLIEDVKLLPHPVSKIKNALKIGIAACILNDTPSNQLYCNSLKVMYIFLGDYVDLSESDKVALDEVSKLIRIQGIQDILTNKEIFTSGKYTRYQEYLASTLQTNKTLEKELSIFCNVVETIANIE